MTEHQVLPPFAAWSGSRTPKILFVGEAWGDSERHMKKPFVGWSGKELFRMIAEAMPEESPDLRRDVEAMLNYDLAWIKNRESWLHACGFAFTNVLAFQPPGNKIPALCANKKEVGKSYDYPPIAGIGNYLRPEYLPELSRLGLEIAASMPTLIVALGNTACWALLRTTAISSIRGTIALSNPLSPAWLESKQGIPAIKVLPTYHPAGVLYNWSWRTIVIQDLMKAAREKEFLDVRRPERRVLHTATLREYTDWTDHWLASSHDRIAMDTETAIGQIKCISFALTPWDSMCIPFMDSTQMDGSYWRSPQEEYLAWRLVERFMDDPRPKLWQNGLYDLQYTSKVKLRPKNCTADLMLLHHSLYPELPKGLGFLGSIYTNEASWKLMRTRKEEELKRDE